MASLTQCRTAGLHTACFCLDSSVGATYFVLPRPPISSSRNIPNIAYVCKSLHVVGVCPADILSWLVGHSIICGSHHICCSVDYEDQ
jgi:hypothetical protein